MRQILYCTAKRTVKKDSFPFSCVITSKAAGPQFEGFSLVVLSESFLKAHKNINASHFPGKTCLIHFCREDKKNIAIVKSRKFFDYFTDQDRKEAVLFKLQRAEQILDSKVRIGNLERELSNRHRRLEKLVLVDPLTGCFNWRYFLRRAQQELSRARRHMHHLSFMVVDIDHFRQINEMYSLQFADAAIKEMAEILRSNLRQEDILARWREDEFLIILPYQTNIDTYKAATRIKNRISTHRFKYGGVSLRLKVSICMVSFPEDKIFNIKDVMNALQRCLIAAKRKGGDAVVLSSQASPVIETTQKEKKPTVDELKTKIDRLNSLLSRDLLEMIFGFARAIEAKDSYTGRHVEDTSLLAEKIAAELKLPNAEAENVKRAAVLHDLGKVGIEEGILSKKGPLTPREREIIKSHPWIATEILREIHGLRGAIPAILYHHERYDGQGYPIGLKGEEIPLSARIVAISDVYQALITDRPYRKAFTKKEALKIIKKESGKQFDPTIVKIFLKVIKKIH
ncbi:MAG: diguanylate cyclase [Candidatus Omnitrophica bacterium]|nr:diguanylate cyclase [Candidatus Omnitrophota bacterium]